MSDLLLPWLRLVHAKGFGPALLQKLLKGFGSFDQFTQASDSRLASIGVSAKVIDALNQPDEQRIEADLNWLEGGADRAIVPLNTPHYPPMLREIPDPPIVLYVRGDPEVLLTPQLAVVGSRKPSITAENHASTLCTELAGFGITITSGLALGVDACAHHGALQADGLTVAVTATGLDRVYPAKHQALAQQIAATGAIVSEFSIGTNPLPGHFPRRNRVISGLAYGTLVIEAALKSGTLTTAAHAAEQSREVFVIPGAVNNPQTRGSNMLIKSGATLVETTADILQQLAPLLPGALEFDQTAMPLSYDDDIPTGDTPVARVLRAINHEALSVDEIIDATGLDLISVTNLTLDLELQGTIRADAAGRFIKVTSKNN